MTTCIGPHEVFALATFDSPAPLCDECWFYWFTEGYTDEERTAAREEHQALVRQQDIRHSSCATLSDEGLCAEVAQAHKESAILPKELEEHLYCAIEAYRVALR